VNWVQYILVLAVRLYQWGISPAKTLFFGPAGQCRFTPSCSQYAAEAVQTHGAMRGSLLAAKRICRCHPWGGCGEDPVPVKQFKVQSSKFKVFESVHSRSKGNRGLLTGCEPISVYAHPHPGPLPRGEGETAFHAGTLRRSACNYRVLRALGEKFKVQSSRFKVSSVANSFSRGRG
jgi:putative membrane protein insertion efficiency factor